MINRREITYSVYFAAARAALAPARWAPPYLTRHLEPFGFAQDKLRRAVEGTPREGDGGEENRCHTRRVPNGDASMADRKPKITRT